MFSVAPDGQIKKVMRFVYWLNLYSFNMYYILASCSQAALCSNLGPLKYRGIR